MNLQNWLALFWQSTVLLIVCLLNTTLYAQPPGSGWRLHFCDEFSGDEIDSLKWLKRYPWGRTHNHDAYMLDENVIVDDGYCTLLAIREPFSGRPFTSGVISTGYTKYTFKHGYVEARILLPNRAGSWPAFWGLYDGWPPENDIMEYPIDTAAGNGYPQSDYHTAFHYSTGGGGNSAGGGAVNPGSAGDLGNSWHTFGVEWIEDDLVRWYFDGQVVRSFGNDSAISQMEHMYLILNYAVGGWPGRPNQTEWPDSASDTTVVDWVRVWQKPAVTGTATYTFNNSNTGSWTGDQNWDLFEPKHSRQIARFETLPGRSSMQVGWNKLKTIGEVYLSGETAYTIGDNDGDLDSLMFADEGDGWARLWVEGGDVAHTVQSRIEIRNRLSVQHLGTQPLSIHGDILGHYREGGETSTGRIYFKGPGQVVLNGDGFYQNSTDVTEGSNVLLNGKLYQGRVADSAVLSVESGGQISVESLASGQSLGYLPSDSQKMVFDNGAIVIRGQSASARGMTIEQGGGRIVAESNASAVFSASPHVFQIEGPLELDGEGFGAINRTITGSGQLIKHGNGTWQISGDNTYQGSTQVLGGVLHVDGQTGTALTLVNENATIQGGGTVRGDLNNSGTILPVGPIDLSDENGLFQLVDNFSSGNVDAWNNSDGNVGFSNAESPTEAGNRVGMIRGGSGGGDAVFLPLESNEIPANSDTATVYFRMLIDPGTSGESFELSVGLGSDFDSTPDSQFDYSVQTVIRDELQAGTSFDKYFFYNNGSSFFTSGNDFWIANEWIDVWYVVDNVVKTYDMFVDTGNGQQQVVDDFSFAATGSNLNSFFLTTGNSFDVFERLFIDDIYVDPNNANLSRPTSGSDQPFDPIGTMVVNGQFNQTEFGTLSLQIANEQTMDQLVVAGGGQLAGRLELEFVEGFEPADGQLFQIIDSLSSLAGQFDSVEDNLDVGLEPELLYLPSGVFVIYESTGVLLGDVNQDGDVNLLDVSPFVEIITSGEFQNEADVNQDGVVNLIDVSPFVELVIGN